MCLDHLFAQDLYVGEHLEVYMVDDGSTDGTAQVIRERFPMVHVISADGTLYWNRGMYRAWEVASQSGDYDYFLWLNDDTMLFPLAIRKMISLSEENHEAAIIVGATKSEDSDTLTYGGRVGTSIPNCDGFPHEVGYFNGNIVLVPKSVYTILGNLDYYYSHSKGDFDYGIRARRAGIKMYQCGDVLGICEAHEHIDNWCNPEIPFRERWKQMWKPTGMPPRETFHLEKQINVLKASLHFMTVILRCIAPRLWLIRQ